VRRTLWGGAGPQELLTRHKALVAEFLEANYDKVGPRAPRAAGERSAALANAQGGRRPRCTMRGRGRGRGRGRQIIPKYTGLLQSENYVTKRQSLKVR